MRVEVWLDRGIGLVEPIGDLDEGNAAVFRRALYVAARASNCSTVLIVEDQITQVSAKVRDVIEFYVTLCVSRGGRLAVVSTDGKLHARGRISELRIVERAYGDLDEALHDLVCRV
jgi:anti-anti-sigma regulatory factor